MFNSLISPVMFIYLIVISVNLGVSITEMVELQDDPAAFIYYCVYLSACLVQLLLFYWHSNEVTEESLLVSYSTFKSDWVGTNRSLQKEMAILAHTTNKRLVFRAGPFNEMSLTTFVSILRGSYSFYTLLNETN
ncbi:odorant receptor 10-like isoform X2 [Epargyreus clarus]